MELWDYQLPKNWQPQNDEQWQWFLVRKINYGEFKGLEKGKLKEYFPQIKKFLDPGKREMLAYFFKND